MNREDIIQMAREAAAQHGHTIKPTDEIVETLTSFALIVEYEASKKAHERGYQLGLEIGAAAEREAIMDEWWMCVQSDLENGVKFLNERAAEKWRKEYPAMAGFDAAIRARGEIK